MFIIYNLKGTNTKIEFPVHIYKSKFIFANVLQSKY